MIKIMTRVIILAVLSIKSTSAYSHKSIDLIHKKKQTIRFSYGYTISEALIDSIYLIQTRKSINKLDVSYGFGLSKRIELSVNVPFTFFWKEKVIFSKKPDVYQYKKNGFGDISFGAKVKALKETILYPGVFVRCFLQFPTGYYSLKKDIMLGDGFFTFSPEVILVKSISPVILYAGGFGVFYSGKKIESQMHNPGNITGYLFGVTFVASEKIDFEYRFSHFYQNMYRFNNDPVFNSMTNKASTSLGIGINASENVSIKIFSPLLMISPNISIITRF